MQHQKLQMQFASHLRDPDNCLAPEGLEDRRMAIYRDLFFNNVKGFLTNGFPVLYSLYAENDWLMLCRSFFKQHACRSPYFVDISKEFVEYLANEYQPKEQDPCFLAELAHYEWVELALSIAKCSGEIGDDQADDNLHLSALAWVLSYQYPVHQISRDFQPTRPSGPHYLVVFRNSQDQVNFIQIDQVNAFLLSTLETQSMRADELIRTLQQAMPQLEKDQVESGCLQALQAFIAQGIVVRS
ncbi:DUF2063 domain-containing protein [Bowmanella denitrificans]|uniref:DUF2063 domain-containing protein n=1 Tax=Bowmanella denitrificans TaxID=366582 RepID=A0ABP3H8M2_9ALTE